MNMTDTIKQKALDLGFDLVGVTDASDIDKNDVCRLEKWLSDGFAGQMDYMHRNFDKRVSPTKLLRSARSVICVGLNYRPEKLSSAAYSETSGVGIVADFALYEDYHKFIKTRLFALAAFIKVTFHPDSFKFKACVDSVPLAERSLAERAGLGFIGRNRMLISPDLGSEILLGELITSVELDCDEKMPNQCSNCDKCVKACPTGALCESGQLDASKCISYLTIEHHGEIPAELTGKTGMRIFGCDNCIKACPFEKNTRACNNAEFEYLPERRCLDLNSILSWQEEDFARLFAGTTVERLGLDRLKRNAQICLDNFRQNAFRTQ